MWACHAVGMFAALVSGLMSTWPVDAAGLTTDKLVADYLDVALGHQYPGPLLGLAPPKLAKRDNDVTTNIILVLAGSMASNDGLVATAKSDLRATLFDFAKHSADFKYRYYDEDEMLEVEKLDRPAARQFVSNSLAVFAGTVEEIDAYARRLEATGVDLEPALASAKSVADVHGSALCVEVSSYKPGGTNEIGFSILFAENPGDGHVDACLYETLMGAFGLGGTMPSGSDSLFSFDTARRPSEEDWAFWRLHLDPRLKPGMSADEVRAVVTGILSKG